MKTFISALAVSFALLAGSLAASTPSSAANYPSWADKVFEDASDRGGD